MVDTIDGARSAAAMQPRTRLVGLRVRALVASPRPAWWRELVLLACLYALYEVGRSVGTGDVASAMRNGRGILHWEQDWHLDAERALNAGLSHLTALAVLSAYFYATLHYLVTPAVLLWMYRSHPDHYRLARTTLVAGTVLGLIGFYVIPTAPPRLLSAAGFTDTLEDVHEWGWWGGDGSVPRGLGNLTNQFAAMPSLHVGWALWSGVLIACFAGRSAVRRVGALYPIATTVVVVATGNHYLLDTLGGAATMAAGLLISSLVLVAPGWVRSMRHSSTGVESTGVEVRGG